MPSSAKSSKSPSTPKSPKSAGSTKSKKKSSSAKSRKTPPTNTNVDASADVSLVEDSLMIKIRKAFEVFDTNKNGTCDIREVGTVLRSLDVYPSEVQLNALIREMEDPVATEFVAMEKFLRVTYRLIKERHPFSIIKGTDDQIFRAFQALDATGKGFLTPEELKRYMTTEGEPFTDEEINEMLATCEDTVDNKVHYGDYVTQLCKV